MKFVRWLGAFEKGTSLSDAATWETGQTGRQVAAEPLWHGRSFLGHAKIGLAIAHPDATFARGWLRDAYTEVSDSGMLISTRKGVKAFKNLSLFLKALNKRRKPGYHAEAAFNAPTYNAVIVKNTATERGKKRAERLAKQLNLPLRTL